MNKKRQTILGILYTAVLATTPYITYADWATTQNTGLVKYPEGNSMSISYGDDPLSVIAHPDTNRPSVIVPGTISNTMYQSTNLSVGYENAVVNQQGVSLAVGQENYINSSDSNVFGLGNTVFGKLDSTNKTEAINGSTDVNGLSLYQSIQAEKTSTGSAATSVIGSNNKVYGEQSQVLGSNNTIGEMIAYTRPTGSQFIMQTQTAVTPANYTTVLGSNNTITPNTEYAISVGSHNTISTSHGIGIGDNTTVDTENSVALGANSYTNAAVDTATATIAGFNMGQFAGDTSSLGVVSVGNTSADGTTVNTRQIKNVTSFVYR